MRFGLEKISDIVDKIYKKELPYQDIYKVIVYCL